MFSWLWKRLRPEKKQADVRTGVWYDKSREEFIVGYTHQGAIYNVGVGNTLSQAVEDLANEVSSHFDQGDKSAARRRRNRGDECPLTLTLYYKYSTETYVMEISDQTGSSYSGEGSSTSHALEDLAENIESVHINYE